MTEDNNVQSSEGGGLNFSGRELLPGVPSSQQSSNQPQVTNDGGVEYAGREILPGASPQSGQPSNTSQDRDVAAWQRGDISTEELQRRVEARESTQQPSGSSRPRSTRGGGVEYAGREILPGASPQSGQPEQQHQSPVVTNLNNQIDNIKQPQPANTQNTTIIDTHYNQPHGGGGGGIKYTGREILPGSQPQTRPAEGVTPETDIVNYLMKEAGGLPKASNKPKVSKSGDVHLRGREILPGVAEPKGSSYKGTSISKEINRVDTELDSAYKARMSIMAAAPGTEFIINNKVYSKEEALAYMDEGIGGMNTYRQDLWRRQQEGYTHIKPKGDGTVSFVGKPDTSLEWTKGELNKIDRGAEHLSGGNKILKGILSGISQVGLGAVSTLAATGEIVGRPLASGSYFGKQLHKPIVKNLDKNRHYVSVFDFALEPLGLAPKGSTQLMLDNPVMLSGGVLAEVGMALAIGEGARFISTPTQSVTKITFNASGKAVKSTSKVKLVPVSKAVLRSSSTTSRSLGDDAIRLVAAGGDDAVRGAGLSDDVLRGTGKLGRSAADDIIRVSERGGTAGMVDDVINAGKVLPDDIVRGSSKVKGVTVKGAQGVTKAKYHIPRRLYKLGFPSADEAAKFMDEGVDLSRAVLRSGGKAGSSFSSKDLMKVGSRGSKRVLNPFLRAKGIYRYDKNVRWVLPSMAPDTAKASSKLIVKPTEFIIRPGDDMVKASVVGYDAAMRQSAEVVRAGRIIGRRSPTLTKALRLGYGSASDAGVVGRGGMRIFTGGGGLGDDIIRGVGGLGDDIVRGGSRASVDLSKASLRGVSGVGDDIVRAGSRVSSKGGIDLSKASLRGVSGVGDDVMVASGRQALISLQVGAAEQVAHHVPGGMLVRAAAAPALIASAALPALVAVRSVGRLAKQAQQVPAVKTVQSVDAASVAGVSERVLGTKQGAGQVLVPPVVKQVPARQSGTRVDPVIKLPVSPVQGAGQVLVPPGIIQVNRPVSPVQGAAPKALQVQAPVGGDALLPFLTIPVVTPRDKITQAVAPVLGTASTPKRVTVQAPATGVPVSATPVAPTVGAPGRPFFNVPWWLRGGAGGRGLGGAPPWAWEYGRRAVFKHRIGDLWR